MLLVSWPLVRMPSRRALLLLILDARLVFLLLLIPDEDGPSIESDLVLRVSETRRGGILAGRSEFQEDVVTTDGIQRVWAR
jgi:hypothetical protein